MGVNFKFATSTRIIFESGSFRKVPGLIQDFGSKVLIVTGKNKNLAHQLSEILSEINIYSEIFSIHYEPTNSDIEQGADLARKTLCHVVVGIGGGSAVDSAKAIAALVPNQGELTDYLEVIGKGRML